MLETKEKGAVHVMSPSVDKEIDTIVVNPTKVSLLHDIVVKIHYALPPIDALKYVTEMDAIDLLNGILEDHLFVNVCVSHVSK